MYTTLAWLCVELCFDVLVLCCVVLCYVALRCVVLNRIHILEYDVNICVVLCCVVVMLPHFHLNFFVWYCCCTHCCILIVLMLYLCWWLLGCNITLMGGSDVNAYVYMRLCSQKNPYKITCEFLCKTNQDNIKIFTCKKLHTHIIYKDIQSFTFFHFALTLRHIPSVIQSFIYCMYAGIFLFSYISLQYAMCQHDSHEKRQTYRQTHTVIQTNTFLFSHSFAFKLFQNSKNQKNKKKTKKIKNKGD